MKNSVPFPITQSLILLAQYSLLHHSTNLLLVSLPIAPPSASPSLLVDVTLGAGDAVRDGMGEGERLLFFEDDSFPFNFPFIFNSLPARVNVSLLPLPNLRHTWPSRLNSLFIWKMRHMSF
jgi:hypothetical protein